MADRAAREPWSADVDSASARQAPGLSARLMALARMIQIGTARSGRDGFSKKLLGQAEDVLGRAGERMKLSSAHTVVVLAGGTGSGKSSLFNRLAGADFSTVGVTRPVTRDAHACIWDDAGSGALLEWLGVAQRNRYSRASALGGGESGLAGLVLLDLPDHDSVMGHATGQVDRLVSLADVMIWVLDPQKYADAAVHERFLIPLAGHAEVQAVVLNQADLLTAPQIEDCVGDLRRLLDAENLHDVPILVTSAVTGSGMDELRALLADGVLARRAAAARISADVDAVVTRFGPYAGSSGRAGQSSDSELRAGELRVGKPVAGGPGAGKPGDSGPSDIKSGNGWSDDGQAHDGAASAEPGGAEPGSAEPGSAEPGGAQLGGAQQGGTERRTTGEGAGAPSMAIPAEAVEKLIDEFYAAAGVSAVADSLRGARELRAADFVGWPVAWLMARLTGRDPLRKERLNMLWNDLRAVSAGPAGAQQAAIDNALTEFGDRVATRLPKPWSVTVRTAARSRADAIPAAVGEAIGAALPGEDNVVRWWRVAGLVQGVLLGAAAIALAWFIAVLVVVISGAGSGLPGLISSPLSLIWAILLGAAALGLGVVTASYSLATVKKRALTETAEICADIRKRIGNVAQELAVMPVEQELSEFTRYREEFATASSPSA